MSSTEETLSRLQQRVWNGSLPLEIRLFPGECRTYEDSDPYMIQAPRLSYLPFLLPRLHSFFRSHLIDSEASAPHDGWFTYEDVPLKWHYPIGLLYDLYAGAEPATAEDSRQVSSHKDSAAIWRPIAPGDNSVRPGGDKAVSELNQPNLPGSPVDANALAEADALPWKITVHFTEWPGEHLPKLSQDGSVLLDAFRNSLKESSFTRHTSNKPIFSLGYEDSITLWKAVEEHNLALFKPVNDKLLDPPGMSTKGIPLRIYLPHMPDASVPAEVEEQSSNQQPRSAGTLRVVQAPIPPLVGGRSSTPQTLGTALNSVLPTLFPSRRSPLLALPVLHGAVVPLGAHLEELSRAVSHADGWLHITIKMMG